jgi:hypothetical protein
MLLDSKKKLAETFAAIATRHSNEPAIRDGCLMFSKWSAAHAEDLNQLATKYGSAEIGPAAQVAGETGARPGGLGLLRDLHDLWLLVNDTHLTIMILVQAARALRDNEMAAILIEIGLETDRQIAWLDTHIKVMAPQTLVVPSI